MTPPPPHRREASGRYTSSATGSLQRYGRPDTSNRRPHDAAVLTRTPSDRGSGRLRFGAPILDDEGPQRVARRARIRRRIDGNEVRRQPFVPQVETQISAMRAVCNEDVRILGSQHIERLLSSRLARDRTGHELAADERRVEIGGDTV